MSEEILKGEIKLFSTTDRSYLTMNDNKKLDVRNYQTGVNSQVFIFIEYIS